MQLKEEERKKLTELILSFSPALALEPCCDSTMEMSLAVDVINSSDLDAMDAMALVSNLRKYHSTRHT
jgi:hypothetical protein